MPLQAAFDAAKAAYAAERKKERTKTPSKERRESDIHSEALFCSLFLSLLLPTQHERIGAHKSTCPRLHNHSASPVWVESH
jgi:hypothetical protein